MSFFDFEWINRSKLVETGVWSIYKLNSVQKIQ